MTSPLTWAGRSSGWRYLAQRIDGTGGTGTWLHNELPLQNVKITDVLSGPPQLTAEVSPVHLEMLASDGSPLLGEQSTVIYAECDGVIRAGCILIDSDEKGPNYTIDCSGFAGYLKDMVYPSARLYIQAEVLDVVRDLWFTVQSDSGSNLGMQVDQFTDTGILLGKPTPVDPPVGTTPDTAPATTSSTDDKPYELNWWTTHDIGGEIDRLAQSTPFDYHERHVWNAAGTDVNHYLDFGYPSIGARRNYLRFVEGENIHTLPDVNHSGTDFANHILVLGAGEGSAKIRGEARVVDGRLRRMEVIDDPSVTDVGQAQRAAQLELRQRQQLVQVATVIVRNTPSAPFGSFGVGDEIRVQVDSDWQAVDQWSRIISMEVAPDVPDLMTLHLIRADWVTMP